MPLVWYAGLTPRLVRLIGTSSAPGLAVLNNHPMEILNALATESVERRAFSMCSSRYLAVSLDPGCCPRAFLAG